MIKQYLAAIAVALTSLSAPLFAGDVNVGVSISGELQPGVYGQVNIGTVPNYTLVNPQPVVIMQQPGYVVPAQPIYLHVPPGHAKHWDKHCREYNACGRRVYFLKSAEYDPGYRDPDYGREYHDHPGKGHKGGKKGHHH